MVCSLRVSAKRNNPKADPPLSQFSLLFIPPQGTSLRFD